MARPTKQGIEYFPVDVQFDDKIELLIADVGSDAVSTIITLWQLIYQNHGYYIEYSEDLFLLIKRRIMLDQEISKVIVNKAIKRGIFNMTLFKNHKVLTSKALQKRYFDAAKRKKIVNVNKNYLCNGINVNDNSTYLLDDVNNNATNVDVDVEVDVKEEVEVEVKEDVNIVHEKKVEKSNKSKKIKYVCDNPPSFEEVKNAMMIWVGEKGLSNIFSAEMIIDIAESFYDHYNSPEVNWTYMAGGNKRTKLQLWNSKVSQWMKRERDKTQTNRVRRK